MNYSLSQQLVSNYEHLLCKLNDNSISYNITRDNKLYKEIYNVDFLFDLRDKTFFEINDNLYDFIMRNKIICPNIEDSLEFDEIYDTFNKLYNLYIKNDLYTRKCVIRPKDYYDGDVLSACISLVQFIVNGNGELDMFIFTRGQMIEKYYNDYCNLCKAYLYAYNRLISTNNTIKLGVISVHVSSYHYQVDKSMIYNQPNLCVA